MSILELLGDWLGGQARTCRPRSPEGITLPAFVSDFGMKRAAPACHGGWLERSPATVRLQQCDRPASLIRVSQGRLVMVLGRILEMLRCQARTCVAWLQAWPRLPYCLAGLLSCVAVLLD